MTQLELFKTFCTSAYKEKEYMYKPFEVDGYVYATDAHKLIRCAVADCEFEVINEFKIPLKVAAVLPAPNCSRIVSTKAEDLEQFKIEEDCDKIGEDIDCAECKGEGEVEWEYKHYTKNEECPICKGSGYSSECRLVPNGKKTFPRFESYICIDSAYFDINILNAIFEVQKVTAGDIISLNYAGGKLPAAFKIGIYEVLIMPVYNSEHTDPLLDISFTNKTK